MASDKGKKSSKTVTTIPANDDGTERKRALDIALAGIEKRLARGAVIRMGRTRVAGYSVIPTGCLSDMALAWAVCRAPRGGNLRSGILRQDDRRAACRCGSAEDGRRGCVH